MFLLCARYFQGHVLDKNLLYFDEVGLRFVVKAAIDNLSTLDLVMSWCQMEGKPLLSYIYDTTIYDITSPQWVKSNGTMQQENIW